ncbi:Acetyl-coenzyme A synthetase [Sinobacterium norvegicum]|uniref:Acetyl-coenzyme A synthetase n=1 Tax=Sinobacterium norvegicum TaxID=1641715 RepID=A0ABM9AIR5_9GAMM|nr:propionyl-CoA synthetase [Sinobacterium norvegicum]CAH0992663.1 Acetyl-coenzyme A synthetase [Sinobacterium norvegicum]
MGYQQAYQRSIEQPEQFWAEQAEHIAWFKKPQTILSNDDNHVPRWFADGEMNSCYLALDYHIEQGRGEQAALIYDSPVTQTQQTYTYLQLRDKVALLAGAMQQQGISKGDRVLIYLPMVAEAAIAMLACARIGAIHSVVFGGFAAKEVASRIDDATPSMILTASCGIEVGRIIDYKSIIDQAIEQAEHKITQVVVLQRPQQPCTLIEGRDIDWQAFTDAASPVDCITVMATDPLYILYTSGTTGKPKGVVRDNGGHAVAMKYSMQAIYDVHPGDVYWAASDVGWVVGHSYIVYAPLFAGCTTVLYEGKPVGTPDAGAFWRVIEQHKVKIMFTAPTAFRAVRKQDPEATFYQQYDTSSLKALYLAGERTDSSTYYWLKELLQKPVIDHWWQTETGWAIVANMIGLEVLETKAGSSTKPVTGFNVQVLDVNGSSVEANTVGEIVVKQPLPPGCFPTVWNNAERYHQTYMAPYPGFYLTGDGGYIDEDGYVFIMGRTDDVINVAGHRFSTGELEELIAGHDAVAEAAVVGIHCDLKGQIPLALVVIKDGIEADSAVSDSIVTLVRNNVGAVASLRQVLLVQRLPKTRSGKILRKTLRQIADGEQFNIPSTIDDPTILEEIKRVYIDQDVIS